MATASGAYRLQFLPQAKQEWDKLDGSIKTQFAKLLLRRLDESRVPSAALTAMPACYKIKLRSTGFHLVYRVQTDALVLLTIAIGKRAKLWSTTWPNCGWLDTILWVPETLPLYCLVEPISAQSRTYPNQAPAP
jgi:mRNA interferase RelE/StbE